MTGSIWTNALQQGMQLNQHICDGFAVFFSDKIATIDGKIHDVIMSGTLPPPVDVVHT